MCCHIDGNFFHEYFSGSRNGELCEKNVQHARVARTVRDTLCNVHEREREREREREGERERRELCAKSISDVVLNFSFIG